MGMTNCVPDAAKNPVTLVSFAVIVNQSY